MTTQSESRMKTVKVNAGYAGRDRVEETAVQIGPEENDKHPVYLAGALIGYVWKGTRTYSPPAYKGSRIVKYHKQVPEWQGGERRYDPRHRRDTRQEVLRDLIAEARRG